MSNKKDYVIGMDFGTSSVRSIIADAHSGEQVALSEFFYPRWRNGEYCDASKNEFRQHPLDYIEGLEFTVKDILEQAGSEIRKNIRAISIATTGSTPVAVNKAGIPLALCPGFEENPNAMFFLWKDHSAIKEAGEIKNIYHRNQYWNLKKKSNENFQQTNYRISHCFHSM